MLRADRPHARSRAFALVAPQESAARERPHIEHPRPKAGFALDSLAGGVLYASPRSGEQLSELRRDAVGKHWLATVLVAAATVAALGSVAYADDIEAARQHYIQG